MEDSSLFHTPCEIWLEIVAADEQKTRTLLSDLELSFFVFLKGFAHLM